MTKLDIIRAGIHFPVGILGAWLVMDGDGGIRICGILFVLSFLFYEAIQEWRKVDWSFKDVIGFLIGLATYPTIIKLWRIL